MKVGHRENLLAMGETSPEAQHFEEAHQRFHDYLKKRRPSREEIKQFSEDLKHLQETGGFIYQQNLSFRKKYQNATLTIPISINQLNNEYILCEGMIGETKVTFFVACGYLKKLKLSPEHEKAKTFNLLDYFDQLIPSRKIIGLVTFQNGIGNTKENFEEMGQKIFRNL